MRNRAKCKLCNEIIESFHEFDYVTCKCKEISISGGQIRFECSAKDWKSFLRVDDNGKEIVVTVQDSITSDNAPTTTPEQESPLQILDNMIDALNNLPQHALSQPLTHYDMLSLLNLFKKVIQTF